MIKKGGLLVSLLSLALRAEALTKLQDSAPLGEQYNIVYNNTLLCGDCILGNFTFCINGPPGFTGMGTLNSVCCSDTSIHGCP